MNEKIAVVQGTRPEIIKNYPIVRALADAHVPFLAFHTNQHYEPAMRDQIYRNFDYEPDRVLDEPYRIGTAVNWLQDEFRREGITRIVVNGDTAASLVGAIAGLYSDIPVVHIEAGLRALDPFMLEERNRIMVDSVASLLFAYTDYEQELLLGSSDVRGKVLVEGNTTVDVIHEFRHKLQPRISDQPYVFVTLHRRELTDSYERMSLVVKALNQVAEELCSVFFPVHPRTRQALQRFKLLPRLSREIVLMEPLDFETSLSMQNHAAVVLTDSGCIQEEAYLLKVPCVTLRDNTERHLSVAHGANVVSGFSSWNVSRLVAKALAASSTDWPDIYGAVGVGQRMVQQIVADSFAEDRPSAVPLRQGKKASEARDGYASIG